MVLIIRKFLAFLSACGIAASIHAYVDSFSGATMDNSLRWVIILGISAFMLHIPIYALEYPASKDRSFFWTGFARGMPSWVVPCIKLLWLIAVAHLVWFLVQSEAAGPAIKDGQYVLSNHGRIVKVLTQREYLMLKEAELRVFSTITISVYSLPMMYWWFPRSHQRAD